MVFKISVYYFMFLIIITPLLYEYSVKNNESIFNCLKAIHEMDFYNPQMDQRRLQA